MKWYIWGKTARIYGTVGLLSMPSHFGFCDHHNFEKPQIPAIYEWSVRDSCCDYGNSKYLLETNFEAEMSMLGDPNQRHLTDL